MAKKVDTSVTIAEGIVHSFIQAGKFEELLIGINNAMCHGTAFDEAGYEIDDDALGVMYNGLVLMQNPFKFKGK